MLTFLSASFLSASFQAMESVSTTIPDKIESPMEFLGSTVGEKCGRKSRRHRVLWLTITADEHEHFLHWLVGDHIPSEISRSALTASPEKVERLVQSKKFETWRTEPHSVLWLHGTGELKAIWWFWFEQSSDLTFSWKRENNFVVSL